MLRLALPFIFALSACKSAAQTATCEARDWLGTPVTVCEVASDADIRLHLAGENGKPLQNFKRLQRHIDDARSDKSVVVAVNAGMYHRDRSPVGLYVEEGVEIAPLVTSAGPGNFHMMPNGVFWIGGDGRARVSTTTDYAALAPDPRLATQSGPMLVIGGVLHPRFLPGGTSRKIRNGVGVGADGTVWLAISDAPVNFHDFATLFRDGLGVEDALYLDGTISRMFIEGERNDGGVAMGPMLAVVE